MKLILRLLFISLFFLNTNNVFSSENIVYLNIDYIMAKSKAGLSINSQLENNHKKNIKKFTDIEKKLKEKEAKIISQKTILEATEYNKKISNLRSEFISYNNVKRDAIEEISQLKVNSVRKLIDSLNPILEEYAKKNSIDMIIQKNNIIMGRSELDITKDILKLLDSKITKILVK